RSSQSYPPPRDFHSFPTRRSSDLGGIVTGFRGALAVAKALLKKGANRELVELRRELATHWMIRRALHHFQQKDYSQLVDLLDVRSEEHTSELQSLAYLVCRLLLEK